VDALGKDQLAEGTEGKVFIASVLKVNKGWEKLLMYASIE